MFYTETVKSCTETVEPGTESVCPETADPYLTEERGCAREKH